MKGGSFFDYDQFMPHGMCYLWKADILWASVISDVVTALAYYSITAAVIMFVIKRKDLPYPWFFILVGSVIFMACGTTHLISAVVIWEPIYGISAIAKTVTAISSLATGIVIWFVLPFFLSLRSPTMLEATVKIRTNELETSNESLNKEVEEHKVARQSLVQVKNYLHNIIDSMASVLIGVDLDGKVTQWNAAAQKATGISMEDVIGMPLAQAYPRLSEETAGIQDAINSRQQWNDPNRSFHQDNMTCYEDLTVYPLIANGVEGAVIRLDDVTEKVKLEQQLRRVQKMDAVGQLTGGIAHDFNNILAIILGNVDLLEMCVVDDDKVLKRVQTIKKTAERAAALTKQLLSFSREDPDHVSVVNINQVIDGMENLIARPLTPEIEIKHHLASDLWVTELDSGKLEDAILNMVINARDAMPTGGNLVFETLNCTFDELFCSQNPGFKVGDYVQLAISDNGVGMSLRVQEHLFEPFFTTKEQGKGTGLGLAMVFAFLKRSHGHIKVYSEVGHGTTFNLYLPKSNVVEEGVKTTTKTLKMLPRGTETILAVDDEEGLRVVAKEALEAQGYRVLTAGTGKEALEILAREPDIKLLFTDIIMPGGLNGYELAKETSANWPDIKILLTSGFTGKIPIDHPPEQPEVRLLNKPYTLSDLACKLREILDSK